MKYQATTYVMVPIEKKSTGLRAWVPLSGHSAICRVGYHTTTDRVREDAVSRDHYKWKIRHRIRYNSKWPTIAELNAIAVEALTHAMLARYSVRVGGGTTGPEIKACGHLIAWTALEKANNAIREQLSRFGQHPFSVKGRRGHVSR